MGAGLISILLSLILLTRMTTKLVPTPEDFLAFLKDFINEDNKRPPDALKVEAVMQALIDIRTRLELITLDYLIQFLWDGGSGASNPKPLPELPVCTLSTEIPDPPYSPSAPHWQSADGIPVLEPIMRPAVQIQERPISEFINPPPQQAIPCTAPPRGQLSPYSQRRMMTAGHPVSPRSRDWGYSQPRDSDQSRQQSREWGFPQPRDSDRDRPYRDSDRDRPQSNRDFDRDRDRAPRDSNRPQPNRDFDRDRDRDRDYRRSSFRRRSPPRQRSPPRRRRSPSPPLPPIKRGRTIAHGPVSN